MIDSTVENVTVLLDLTKEEKAVFEFGVPHVRILSSRIGTSMEVATCTTQC
jgi:hypothetical protein